MTIHSLEEHQTGKPMLRNEWLLTNGLGGYAGSTTGGVNTRKYHGLLIASLVPPVDRRLMVSKLEEKIRVNDESFSLAANLINDLDLAARRKNIDEINQAKFSQAKEAETKQNINYLPAGYKNLLSFSRDPFPTYTYQVNGILLEKSIYMVYQQNTTVVNYRILETKPEAKLELSPLLNARDHNLEKLKPDLDYQIVDKQDNQLALQAEDVSLNILWNAGQFNEQETYFTGMYYPLETSRGETNLDDHYIPGRLVVDIGEEKEFSVVFSTNEITEIENQKWKQELVERKERLIANYPVCTNDFIEDLIVAADDFITYRASTDKKTIMAGYPWFTDWGRDTMISLPGLTLATGRYQEAEEILTTFALNIKDGLLPNVFDDHSGEAAEYNTVDATLWFFQAIKEYYDATEDKEFMEWIYPKLEAVIQAHKEGTAYNIQVDFTDGLLTAGEEGVQLTWMDAKVGDWVVTPRQGKAVEINALWYNALKVFNELGSELGEENKNLEVISLIEANFTDVFWYEEGQYLYDVVTKEGADSRLRPNQCFAVSLPYTLLSREQEKAVIAKVYEELYTPVGLRSLAPQEDEYQGQCKGRRAIRDAAYHQGTVWGWLIGSFFEGYLKVNDYSAAAKEKVWRMYQPFKEHINSFGLGSISEVFDGDFPHRPRGCYAQAWSVAELLRIYTKYLAE